MLNKNKFLYDDYQYLNIAFLYLTIVKRIDKQVQTNFALQVMTLRADVLIISF